MGSIFSFFKRDQPIEKVLEKIDLQIKQVEARSLTHKNHWRRWITSLLIYFFIFEAIYCIYFYFYVFKVKTLTRNEWYTKLLWSTPIILIPLLGYIIKKGINAYYSRRVKTDVHFLAELKAQQKAKLEEFAKKTDFYKTQALMDRYRESIAEGPEKKKPEPQKTQQIQNQQNQELRQRNTQSQKQAVQQLNQQYHQKQQQEQQQLQQQQLQQQYLLQQQQLQQQQQQSQQKEENSTPPQQASEQSAPTPRYIMPIPKDHNNLHQQTSPVIPEKNVNKAWYDKIVDLVIGDDPTTTVPLPKSPTVATAAPQSTPKGNPSDDSAKESKAESKNEDDKKSDSKEEKDK